jgi:phosphate transport system permease protein
MSGPGRNTVDDVNTLQRTASGDRWYRLVLTIAVATVPALLLVLVWQLWRDAGPAVDRFGLGFILGSGWDPVLDEYGAAELLAGTFLTTLLATLLAAPLAVAGAFWQEVFAPRALRRPLTALVDLLAAIPGVVYGLWGVLVMLPWCRAVLFPALQAEVGWFPGLDGIVYGPSLLAASLLLAVMIFPFVLVVSRQVLRALPAAQSDAALALGATRWEVTRRVLFPSARRALGGAVLLGAGRAVGEAIAVAMVIGASHGPVVSLLAPGYTLASVLPHEFAEATSAVQVAALSYATLILLVVAVATNAAARLLLGRGITDAGGQR